MEEIGVKKRDDAPRRSDTAGAPRYFFELAAGRPQSGLNDGSAVKA
jgi:hypothetical protein